MRRLLTLPGGEVEFDLLGDRRASRAPDGPALVLLHEGLGSLELWRDFPRVLASLTGRMVLVWSRYGYGQSAVVAEPRAVGYMHEEALGSCRTSSTAWASSGPHWSATATVRPSHSSTPELASVRLQAWSRSPPM